MLEHLSIVGSQCHCEFLSENKLQRNAGISRVFEHVIIFKHFRKISVKDKIMAKQCSSTCSRHPNDIPRLAVMSTVIETQKKAKNNIHVISAA